MRKISREIMIFLFISILLSLTLDRFLVLLGFPVDIPFQYSHPKNYEEKRSSIEFKYFFTTNDQGIRYKNIPPEKPENETRIFLVGDSFTEGYGVESHHVFGSILEDHFNRTNEKKVRFINGGLSGTGPLEYWRVFYHVGLKYKVDGLLVCIYANDVSNSPVSISHKELYSTYVEKNGIKKILHYLYPSAYCLVGKAYRRYERERNRGCSIIDAISQKAIEIGISNKRIEEWRKALPEDLTSAVNRGEFNGAILSIALMRPSHWADSLDINTKEAESRFHSMQYILNTMIDEALGRGIEVGLVYIPAPFQYDPSIYESWKPLIKAGIQVREHWLMIETELQRRLGNWARQRELPFLDLTPVFRKEIRRNSNLNWKLDGHWNPQGHSVAGKGIMEWIEMRQVFTFL